MILNSQSGCFARFHEIIIRKCERFVLGTTVFFNASLYLSDNYFLNHLLNTSLPLSVSLSVRTYTPTFNASAHVLGRVCAGADRHRQTHARRASVTRHIRRTRRFSPAADSQLPVVVGAPALDPAPAHNRARVVESQCDGDGGDACNDRQRGIEQAMKKIYY